MTIWAVFETLRRGLEAAGIPAPPRTEEHRYHNYKEFRTGLHLRDVVAMMWSPDPDRRTWRRKSLGPILYEFWCIKQQAWKERERRDDEAALSADTTLWPPTTEREPGSDDADQVGE